MYLSVLLVFGLTMNAQKIVPLENKYGYNMIDRNEEIYFKDSNNILERFVGTWKGTYLDKQYEFRIEKNTTSYKTMKYDRLLVRYIITNLNGGIIENTTSLPDLNTYVMKGNYYINNGYQLSYIANGGNCSQRGVITLYVDDTNLQKMDAILSIRGGLIDVTECPTMINQFFPTGIIFNLIKQ